MRFSPSHEWIVLDGKVGTVGITDYAQKELGEVVYVELPEVGKKVEAGEEVCVLESTKAASDVYSPVSGKILAVNAALKESPSHINQSAESTAWLFQIELSRPDEETCLMSLSEYKALIS